jgi:DNA polymerase-1
MFQLVDDDTQVYLPGRGKSNGDKQYDAAGVEEKIGVKPEQVVDLKGLMGDSSDNIPGVKGIGPKTAKLLIDRFGSLQGVYEALDSGVEDPVLTDSVVDKLKTDRENALISKELATIMKDAPVSFQLDDCLVEAYDKQKANSLFQELNFKSLMKLLPNDAFEVSVQEALF